MSERVGLAGEFSKDAIEWVRQTLLAVVILARDLDGMNAVEVRSISYGYGGFDFGMADSYPI